MPLPLAQRLGCPQRATGIAAKKDKMGDPSRMVDHVSHGDRTAASTHAEQHEAIKACSRNNGIQVLGVFVERKLHAFAIGKATAPPVVTDQCVMPRQQGQPGSPDRAIPVVFQVVSPKLHPHQRRTRAAGRIGDARAIGARAESNFLSRLGHADQTPCEPILILDVRESEASGVELLPISGGVAEPVPAKAWIEGVDPCHRPLLGLNAREPDNLGPFLGFICDEFAEFCRRTRKCR